jgi:hypothetical protein
MGSATEFCQRHALRPRDCKRHSLHLTDVAAFGERLVYLAAAENSPDTVRDGVVVGAAGLNRNGPARAGIFTGTRGSEGRPDEGFVGSATAVIPWPRRPLDQPSAARSARGTTSLTRLLPVTSAARFILRGSGELRTTGRPELLSELTEVLFHERLQQCTAARDAPVRVGPIHRSPASQATRQHAIRYQA